MSEPARNEELALVFRGKDNTLPLAIGRAAFAQVNRHVKDLAFHHADEL